MIQQTADSGFIIIGVTDSDNGDVTGFHGGGGDDYWVVKTDQTGNIQWQKCLGGTSSESASSVQQTSDGGYIISGTTSSNNGDVTGFHGRSDYWIVKLDYAGNLQWQKSLGGSNYYGDNSGYDKAYSVKQALDGGYVAIGRSNSGDGDVTGLHVVSWYYSDYWIIKLNSAGIIQWQKCLGGYEDEEAHSMALSNDSGFVITGTARSNSGDVTGNHDATANSSDYWVVKLNSIGNIVWQKCYGGSKNDNPSSICNTTDKGFVIAGNTNSYDGDVMGRYDSTNNVGWVIKIDSIGNLQWQKLLSGSATSVIQTQDGGFLISGNLTPNDSNAYVSMNDYYWMIKLDSNHNFQWHSCDGNINGGYCVSAIQTFDSQYALLGFVYSNGGDVSGTHGGEDIWLVKFSELNIIKSKNQEICSLCNGLLTVNISGGTLPYSYLWNTGATTDSISNLCHGNYSVTVTDASGHSGFCSDIIINDTVRVYGTHTPATCWFCPNGSATLHPSGGSNVYHYSWQGFSDTTATLSGLPHGSVYGCVTDSLGCVSCVGINVQSPVGINEINKADEYLQIFPNPTSTKINLQIPKQFGEPNRVQIYSSIGKLIITVEHSLVLDLTTFDKGIYFIVVTNERVKN
ncbi:MAG: T9SS type A sorting domain-containing protein [Bacteroidetes bacterium]|nr:T9SS type A sorting domain-containing protein [Bacteroidota bacterium]